MGLKPGANSGYYERHNQFDQRLYDYVITPLDGELKIFQHICIYSSNLIPSKFCLRLPRPDQKELELMIDWLNKFTAIFNSSSGNHQNPRHDVPDGNDLHTSDKTLIYLHMAKTGGATLGDILNRQFQNDAIVLPGSMDVPSALGLLPSQQVIQKFRDMPSQQWATARLVPGHFMFGIHRGIPRPASYLTMLRHPVSRVVSSYYYILEQPGIPVRDKIIAGKLDLAAYVESGLGLDPHNYQTRVMAGLPEHDATWETTADVLKRGLPESVLELAQHNIENHVPYIGVTERFDEFLLLLKLTFNWPLERILYKRINETRNRPAMKDIPTETVELITARNSLDLRLYEFARKRFDVWAEPHKDAVEYLLPRFKELNQVYQPSQTRGAAKISELAARIDAGTPGGPR